MQVAGTSGTVRLEDFVIPRNEKIAQFQVRDGQFLADNATRVSQAAEERTVATLPPSRAIASLCCKCQCFCSALPAKPARAACSSRLSTTHLHLQLYVNRPQRTLICVCTQVLQWLYVCDSCSLTPTSSAALEVKCPP